MALNIFGLALRIGLRRKNFCGFGGEFESQYPFAGGVVSVYLGRREGPAVGYFHGLISKKSAGIIFQVGAGDVAAGVDTQFYAGANGALNGVAGALRDVGNYLEEHRAVSGI